MLLCLCFISLVLLLVHCERFFASRWPPWWCPFLLTPKFFSGDAHVILVAEGGLVILLLSARQLKMQFFLGSCKKVNPDICLRHLDTTYI